MRPVAGREILGNVPHELQLALYGAMLVAVLAAAAKLFAQVSRWRRGGSESKLLPLRGRLRELLRRALAQRNIAAGDPVAGAMHRLIFWGFVLLLLATTLTSIEHNFGIEFLHGAFYLAFAFVSDFAGLALLTGLALAVYRRYVVRTARLAHGRRGDLAALGLLLSVGMTGFLLEGARIALDDWPAHERLSFVGWASGLALASLVPADGWSSLHRALWGLHAVAAAGVIAALPFTRLLHAIAAPLNIALRARPLGALRANAGAAAPAGTLDAFTWKQLLELDACTSCGRCSAHCPATTSGKPLSPMLLVQHLRERLADPEVELIPGAVTPDELWSCTTCAACEEACPVAINHVDRIVDLRRVLVERGDLDPTAARGLESMLDKGNAWDQPPRDRIRWTERLRVHVLAEWEPCETIYWVGCAGAYDEDARRVTEAVAKLLDRAGIPFGILGSREGCSGDLARRIGDEGLFTELARRNVAMFREHGVRRIITHCPHCLNTMRSEYDGLEGIEIVHHSALLEQLVRDGRLVPKRGLERRITFHDPCTLGRYNDGYDAPRTALGRLPQAELVEMPRNRERSFCCGGGGGQFLIDVKIGERIPSLRFAEASASGADVVATACPFCKIMLTAASAEPQTPRRIEVKDVAELLADACE